MGWEEFTDQIIATISSQLENVVFLLWGSYAQRKSALINSNKHLILKSVHPSPLSAYRGFFGCRHFSQANDYLKASGRAAIDWKLG
jgi:uracil-DNA glycosylase